MSEADHERRAVELVMGTTQYAETLHALVERTGRNEADLREDSRTALAEMAAYVDESASRVWDRMGRWLTRSYEVDVDTSTLADLAELGRRHSLVFLPNHRSYLDPLVLRAAMAGHGFPSNYTLGGINLAMWPLSELGRRSGLIFIRRSTRDDPVYPAMLRLYLGFLLRQHANLEWYFEGGRTRTGKLRPPRMGVLRYLVDAFRANGDRADDAYLVPVSIVYDQQHEVSALSREEGGGTKTPESLTWLYRFARAQGRRRGRVHVRFGPPLSLRDALVDAGSRAETDDLTAVVPRVAFEVAHRINAATPITPSALVAFGLLDNDGRAMTLAETLGVLEPLVAYVRRRQLPLTADVDLGRPEGLRKALATLVREGVVVEYAGGLEPVYAIAPDRQHEAAFYRNTVTHYFIDRAILEVALVQAAGEDPDADVVAATWTRALALRDLLKYEFFFATKHEFDAQLRYETDLMRPGWAEEVATTSQITGRLSGSHLLLAHRVIGPFLEAYSVVADRLVTREPAAPLDRDGLIAESLGFAHQRWLQQDLHSPESISKDLMGGALKLAGNRDLLGPGGDELRRSRQHFADELAAAVEAIAVVRSLALKD
ncbi:1-acyl-sn-glycerol-3-phosphate acyltransferase [Nocardioides donggukensis]|uniref:1-acyl-sn-glycerol-3-phosphate acyltransferase n=1 Tax=Nocardioides donggukensis TaxID=2774019 RepID=A0A927K550_9ACTN|nr:1-acyl-sn-glycerol-3-phosphate acyltransferase [Nocardioides donggukensis]MBD8869315.1 1-acyl-sn-glycerol-3-phosphate acyltransferase [Nocardioides donggukensis]